MKIKYNDNFCRLFKMPSEYPKGFCFSGGKPCNFEMIDWFNPVGVEFDKNLEAEIDWVIEEEKLIKFIQSKTHLVNGKYLLVTDFGKAIVIDYYRNPTGRYA